ncbi:MAG: hypothetical protein QW692_02900 [Nitrososphaerota archaeon]
MSMFLKALKPSMDLFIYTPEKWQGESLWIKELARDARPMKSHSLHLE